MGRRVEWEPAVLERLHKTLCDVAPQAQFVWTNQQLVHMHMPGVKEPWVTLHTKRPEHVQLTLVGPKNGMALGRVSELGFDRDLDGRLADFDQLRIRFRKVDDLDRGDLVAVLKEHLAICAKGE